MEVVETFCQKKGQGMYRLNWKIMSSYFRKLLRTGAIQDTLQDNTNFDEFDLLVAFSVLSKNRIDGAKQYVWLTRR